MYRVKAIWKTLQGEGLFAGRPAVFVRFVGCNMWTGYEADRERDAARTGASCSLWCDTEFTKEGSHAYAAAELAARMQDVGDDVRFCVLTGGEPLLQVDATLIHALHKAGFQVAIETNGTVRLKDTCWDAERNKIMGPDWIVCSPKLPEEQLVLEYFDELKLVVPDYLPEAYATFAERQRMHKVGGHRIPLRWLQPEDGPRLQDATQLAIDTALAHPSWRVSVQTHKVLDVE
jgi:organic radical activating enzyme